MLTQYRNYHYFICFLLLTITSVASATTIEKITRYSLEIDAEKSYFKVSLGGVASDSELYSISGLINLFERYEKSESGVLNETKLSSIAIKSELDSIDLSNLGFWNENYSIFHEYVPNTPRDSICACFTLIDFLAPHMSGEFGEQKLELNGEGWFEKGDVDGVYRIKYSLGFSGTDYNITYHVGANVVSAVPVPAAFYLFFSGIAGLMVSRIRKG